MGRRKAFRGYRGSVLGETLSDIIKSHADDEPWDAQAGLTGVPTKAADVPLKRAGVLAAIGAMSLMAALGIWVGEFLRVTGR
jgi:hypothetical protein